MAQSYTEIKPLASLAGFEQNFDRSAVNSFILTDPMIHEKTSSSSLGRRGDEQRKRSRPRLLKMKSMPSSGALATNRKSQSKMLERGDAVKDGERPASPTFLPDFLIQSTGSIIPPSAHAIGGDDKGRSNGRRTKARIRPLIQRTATKQTGGIDLSKSMTENESLNLYVNSNVVLQDSPTLSTAPFPRDPFSYTSMGRGANDRLPVTTSHIVSSNNTMQPTPQMLPRGFDSRNVIASHADGEEFDDMDDEAGFGSLSKQTSLQMNQHASLNQLRPIHNETSSARHIRGHSSSTTASSSNMRHGGESPWGLQYPTYSLSPDLANSSPETGRSSLDSILRKQRSRSNTAQTSESIPSATTVQQLRKQFQEKEAAKDRKYQEAAQRALDREKRRQEKDDEKNQMREEKRQQKRQRAQSNAAASEPSNQNRWSRGSRRISTASSMDFQSRPYRSDHALATSKPNARLPNDTHVLPASMASSWRSQPSYMNGVDRSVPSHLSVEANRHQSYHSYPYDDPTRRPAKHALLSLNDPHLDSPDLLSEKPQDPLSYTETRKTRNRERRMRSQWALFLFRLKTFWIKFKKSLGMRV